MLDKIKSTEHALRDYGWMNNCWRDLPFQIALSDSGNSVSEWVLSMVDELNKENQELLWCYCGQYSQPEMSQCSKIPSYRRGGLGAGHAHLEDYRAATKRRNTHARRVDVVHWKLPKENVWKLNVDEVVRWDSAAGLGGVLRGAMGTVRWCFVQQVGRVESIQMAKAMAVREGVTHHYVKEFKILLQRLTRKLFSMLFRLILLHLVG